MDGLQNLIRREIERQLARTSKPSIGTIDSYRPDIHAAKVKLQPEGVMTGWLPLASVAAGAGGGFAAGPNIGDQVIVHFPDGDRNAGVISGRLYSDQDAAPNVPSGQLWYQDASGSVIKLLNNGEVDIVASGSTVKLLANGDVVVTPAGDLHLGGTGGQPVARVGDSTATGGLITSGSSKVFAV